jgi:hypothetical protein
MDSKGLTSTSEFLKRTRLDGFGPHFNRGGYKKGYKGEIWQIQIID